MELRCIYSYTQILQKQPCISPKSSSEVIVKFSYKNIHFQTIFKCLCRQLHSLIANLKKCEGWTKSSSKAWSILDWQIGLSTPSCTGSEDIVLAAVVIETQIIWRYLSEIQRFDSIIQVSKEDPVLARHLPYQSDIEPARDGGWCY